MLAQIAIPNRSVRCDEIEIITCIPDIGSTRNDNAQLVVDLFYDLGVSGEFGQTYKKPCE